MNGCKVPQSGHRFPQMLRPVVNVRFGKAAAQLRDPRPMSGLGRPQRHRRLPASNCCDRSNGVREPTLTDAASCANERSKHKAVLPPETATTRHLADLA